MKMSELDNQHSTGFEGPTPIVHRDTGGSKYANYGEDIAIAFMCFLIVATAIFILWRLALLKWRSPDPPPTGRYVHKDSDSDSGSREVTESDAEEEGGAALRLGYRHGSLKRQDTLDFDETEDSRMCGQFTPQSFVTH